MKRETSEIIIVPDGETPYVAYSTVFVASPFRHDNPDTHSTFISYAKHLCRMVSDKQGTPIAPHLLYPTFLDDKVASDRERGMRHGSVLIERCDICLFGISYGFSEGMVRELHEALSLNKKIILCP